MPQTQLQRSFETNQESTQVQEGFLCFGDGNQLALGSKRKGSNENATTFGSTRPAMKKPKFSPISEFESAGDSAMIDSFEVCGPTVFNHYSATSTNQDTRNGFHCSENRINALQYDAFCSMTMNADNRTTGTVEQSSCDDSMQVAEPQNSNTSMDAETNHFDINNHRNDNASGQIIPVQLCNANGYNKFDDYRISMEQREKRFFNPNPHYTVFH